MKKIKLSTLKQSKYFIPGIAITAIVVALGAVLIVKPSLIFGRFAQDLNTGTISENTSPKSELQTTQDKIDNASAEQDQTAVEPPSTSGATSTTSTDAPTQKPPTSQVTPPPSSPTLPLEDTYPKNWAMAPIDTVTDTWGMMNRESVSYTAWKVNEKYGSMPKWGFEGLGMALRWLDGARRDGIQVGTTPKQFSVGIKEKGALPGIGFSGWVEKVNTDNSITITSYNWGYAEFKTMTVPPSFFESYIYFQ